MESRFKDHYGNPLMEGIYFAGDGLDGDFYFIKIQDSNNFSAETFDGRFPIKDCGLFARQLIPLALPKINLEFALSKINQT